MGTIAFFFVEDVRMHVFTIQLGKWRLARNRDITVLDTSIKTGTSIFAPSWEMVLDWKNQRISEEEYTELYRARMNESWRQNKQRWIDFIESDDYVALGCMCGAGTFCHRHLLKDILEKLCKHRNVEFYYYGELT